MISAIFSRAWWGCRPQAADTWCWGLPCPDIENSKGCGGWRCGPGYRNLALGLPCPGC